MSENTFIMDKDLYSLHSERQEWAFEKEPRDAETEPEEEEESENGEK